MLTEKNLFLAFVLLPFRGLPLQRVQHSFSVFPDYFHLGTWKIPKHHLTSIFRPPLIDSHSQHPQNSTTIPAVLLNQVDQI
jgi:hypothetical protein